ncbi:MAG: HAD family phosphatase [Erysipelotrichaceae bacterium]|nr:HAD family phosphatase [Erysipelotrichaceae bacterium]MBQ7889593.1 HAD family phosphatase [Erysipelotrichaceae bacterium]
MNIKCLIFDCDGLMFNTEYYSRQNWLRIGKKYNLEMDEWMFEQITGAGPTHFQWVMDQRPLVKEHLAEIRANRNPTIAKAIEELGNINKKGLVELLTYLKESAQYKVCIASSSPQEYVKWLIGTIGYDYPFDVIMGGNMVKNAKPDPEIFLKAAELAGIQPEHCLVLEDSKLGHQAAKSAGMHRMFIKDLVEPDDEFKALIEFKKNDLSEVIDFLKKYE